MEALAHYSADVLVEAGALVATIYAPQGLHPPGRIATGPDDPLATLGVAQRSRHGERLWAMMIDNFGAAPGLTRPAEPWCAVALHPALAMHIDAAHWLGDLERCIAWAWITRDPPRDLS